MQMKFAVIKMGNRVNHRATGQAVELTLEMTDEAVNCIEGENIEVSNPVFNDITAEKEDRYISAVMIKDQWIVNAVSCDEFEEF